MSALTIVLIVIAALLVLLFIGGLVASARRRRRQEAGLHARLQEADHALARAHAQDRGWEPRALERAAREAFAERSDAEIRELELVQAVDRPGTEEDEVVFNVVTDQGRRELRLHRRGDAWHAEPG